MRSLPQFYLQMKNLDNSELLSLAQSASMFNFRSKLLMSNLISEVEFRTKSGSISPAELLEFLTILHDELPTRVVDLANLINPNDKSLIIVNKLLLYVGTLSLTQNIQKESMADNTAALKAQEPALLKILITELQKDSIDLVEQSSLGPVVDFLIDICTPETWPTVRQATQLCLKKLGQSGANLDYDFPTVLGLVRLYMHEGKQGPNFKVFCQILATSLKKRTPNLTYLPLIYAKAQKHPEVKGRQSVIQNWRRFALW